MVEQGQTPRQSSSWLSLRLRGRLVRRCHLQLAAVVILVLSAVVGMVNGAWCFWAGPGKCAKAVSVVYPKDARMAVGWQTVCCSYT